MTDPNAAEMPAALPNPGTALSSREKGSLNFKQVSRSTETLAALIEKKEIPKPLLMSWQTWEQWRRDVGRRPIIKVGSEGTSVRQEAELWQATMAICYGENWRTELVLQEKEREERMGATELEKAEAGAPLPSGANAASASSAGAGALAGLVVPLAGGGGAVTPPLGGGAGAVDRENSPGSGRELPGRKQPYRFDMADNQSNRDSWKSTVANSPGAVQLKIMEIHDPSIMTLDAYKKQL